MNQQLLSRMGTVVGIANDFCVTIQNAPGSELPEFVKAMTNYLPRLYWEFANIELDEEETSDDADDFRIPVEYMDEDYYDSIRRNLEGLFGAEDTYLETFDEDMKFSDTPIGASISENLADIFQDLYNFVSAVKETEGDLLEEAFRTCRDYFEMVWGQKLVNVMRPLNNLRFSSRED